MAVSRLFERRTIVRMNSAPTIDPITMLNRGKKRTIGGAMMIAGISQLPKNRFENILRFYRFK